MPCIDTYVWAHHLTRTSREEFAGLINGIKDADETDINRLTELSVKWVTLNLNPMAVGELDYKGKSIIVTSVHSGSHSKLHFRQGSVSL